MGIGACEIESLQVAKAQSGWPLCRIRMEGSFSFSCTHVWIPMSLTFTVSFREGSGGYKRRGVKDDGESEG